MRRNWWLALLVTTVTVGTSSQALAFRTAADLEEFEGVERVAWDVDEISLHLSTRGPEPFESDDLEETIRTAAQVWSEPTCGALEFAYGGLTRDEAKPGDGENTIQWIEDWAERGFPPDAAAITDVQYAGRDGDWSIVEADIYFNGYDIDWTLGSDTGEAREVLAVLVHELGHVLGLLHPCEAYGVDGAPDCYQEHFDPETTMFPLYDADQNSLDFDDIGGMCFLYPAAEPLPQLGEDPCADRACACDDVSNCPAGYSCDDGFCSPPDFAPSEDPPSSCTDCEPDVSGGGSEDLRAFGDVCSEANECLGGECLAGLSESPVCTHACDSDAECPNAWFCTSVESKHVCTPAYLAGGGGCAIDRPGSGPVSAAFLAVLVAAGALRRSRKRHHQLRPPMVRRSS